MQNDKGTEFNKLKSKKQQAALDEESRMAQLPPPIDAKTYQSFVVNTRPLPTPPTANAPNKQQKDTKDNFRTNKGGMITQRIFALSGQNNKEIKTTDFAQDLKSVNFEARRQKLSNQLGNSELVPFNKKIDGIVRSNKGYQQAKSKLQTESLIKEFEKEFEKVMNEIHKKIEEDIQKLRSGELKKPETMDEKKFLLLSFLYRTYERCLEIDHLKWEKYPKAFVPAIDSSEFKLLFLMEVALNYYQDFYKNIQDIKSIKGWENLDRIMREKEVWAISPSYLKLEKVDWDTLKTWYHNYIEHGKAPIPFGAIPVVPSSNLIFQRSEQPNESIKIAIQLDREEEEKGRGFRP